jgi:hypothetical protein
MQIRGSPSALARRSRLPELLTLAKNLHLQEGETRLSQGTDQILGRRGLRIIALLDNIPDVDELSLRIPSCAVHDWTDFSDSDGSNDILA